MNECQQAINLAGCGRRKCNKMLPSGKIVARFPESIDQPLRDAHHRLHMSETLEISYDLMSDGTRKNYRILQ